MKVTIDGHEILVTLTDKQSKPVINYCWEMVCCHCNRSYRAFRSPRLDRKNYCTSRCALNMATKVYREKDKKK